MFCGRARARVRVQQFKEKTILNIAYMEYNKRILELCARALRARFFLRARARAKTRARFLAPPRAQNKIKTL